MRQDIVCLYFTNKELRHRIVNKNVSRRLHLDKLLEPEYEARQITVRAHNLNYEPHLTKVQPLSVKETWEGPVIE